MTAKRKSMKRSKNQVLWLILLGIFMLCYILFGPAEEQGGVVLLENGALSSEQTMTVHFIDVGQGDAALIVMPSGETMLIDAGPNASEKNLLAYLEKISVKTIDYAIFTHPHEDHIGGADSVLRTYPVETVILPDADASTATYERMLDAIDDADCACITAQSGDTYSLGAAQFTILAPNSDTYNNTNNYSIVLRLTYGKSAFLFTGDAEILSEDEILSIYGTAGLRADVLKLGHHGSSTSTSDPFLDAVSPQIAIASCGRGNEYGHPHLETREKLTKRGITFLRTDVNGTIRILTDGEAMQLVADSAA